MVRMRGFRSLPARSYRRFGSATLILSFRGQGPDAVGQNARFSLPSGQIVPAPWLNNLDIELPRPRAGCGWSGCEVFIAFRPDRIGALGSAALILSFRGQGPGAVGQKARFSLLSGQIVPALWLSNLDIEPPRPRAGCGWSGCEVFAAFRPERTGALAQQP